MSSIGSYRDALSKVLFLLGSWDVMICLLRMPSIMLSDEVEPILAENPQRFCMFPIKYPQVWEMYKKAEASFWTGMHLSF